MTDASTGDARIAWTVGGSLLIANALVPLLTRDLFVPGLSVVAPLLWAAALVIFAVGVRGQGSVVARRPLGVTALLIAAAVPLASTVFWIIVPVTPDDSGWAVPTSQAIEIVLFAALLIATVQIARAGVLPRSVRWVPLIVLLVAAAGQVAVSAVFLNAQPTEVDDLALLFFASSIALTAGQLVLGILALVLAQRQGSTGNAEPADPVQVYPPSA